MLARRATERRSLKDVEALREIQARYAIGAMAHDAVEAVRNNIQFHKRLYAVAGNPEAELLLEGRTRVVRTVAQSLDAYVAEDRQPVIAEHDLIIEAFAAGEAEACGKAVFEHVTNAHDRLYGDWHALNRDCGREQRYAVPRMIWGGPKPRSRRSQVSSLGGVVFARRGIEPRLAIATSPFGISNFERKKGPPPVASLQRSLQASGGAQRNENCPHTSDRHLVAEMMPGVLSLRANLLCDRASDRNRPKKHLMNAARRLPGNLPDEIS